MPETVLAVIGLGYWGPNLLRNAWELEGARVAWICDRDPVALERQGHRYPGVGMTPDIADVLADPEVDGLLVSTPISTHFELGRRALEAGKHVFIEKPMAAEVSECEQLIAIARERSLCLMPGHTFLYSPPVVKIKEMLDAGELGKLHFGTSTRVNLGIHQGDASVVRDLAPHDFSILQYWFGDAAFVRAIARASLVPDHLDVAFIDLGYDDQSLFHVEISWLAPTKLRRTVLVGSEKMVVYDDTATEQLRVFDWGHDMIEPKTFGEFQLSYRSGDVLSPRLAADEPLSLEVADFAAAIREGRDARATPELGLEVVRLVEATERSLDFNAAPVWLSRDPGQQRREPDRRRSDGGMPIRWTNDQ
ncbi:MAG TPA: Gfo/Idh/MocA family oxidoreductase [Solirubrobacteraceae bacterium]